MKKSIAILSTVAAAFAVSLVASPAHAEDASLHFSGGATENLNAPWDQPGKVFTANKFHTGGSAEGSLLFPIVPNLAVGPDVAVTYLPQTAPNSEAPVVWQFGAAARLQGARGDNSWSPYLQVSGSAIKQGTIWNPGVATVLGAEFAVESTHTLWIGPYVSAARFFQVHTDAASQTQLLNRDDANVATIGLSVSFDMPVRQKVVTTTTTVTNTATEVPCPVVVTKTVVAPAPVAAPAPESFQLSERVLFQKDSSTLDATAKSVLDAVVYEMSSHPGYSVVVEGSASAEGDATHNLSLSHSRATSVVNYLTSGGVSSDRLNTVSRGAVGNPNDGSNRSVDFLVITLVKN